MDSADALPSRVELRSFGGRRVAVKTAEGTEQVTALRRESELLRRATHPGVVALVHFDETDGRAELMMTAPGEQTLEAAPPTDPATIGSIVATLADVVADLHGIGIAHGAIRPEHVVLGDDRRAYLCGFGSARLAIDPARCAADVHALATLIDWLAEVNRGDAALGRALRELATTARTDDLNARAVAVAAAALAESGAKQSSRSARAVVPAASAKRAALVIVVVAVVAAFATAGGSPAPHNDLAVVTAPTASRAPTPAPVVEHGATRYVVGLAGDRALVGAWDCHGERVALLRPATGDVYVFGEWAALDRPVSTPPVARVPGAQELRTQPGESCSHLVAATDRDLVVISTSGG